MNARQRICRRLDRAIGAGVVFAGLFAFAWYPGAALATVVGEIWPGMPWIAVTVARAMIGLLVIVWAKLSMSRHGAPDMPSRCSINVHVFADETAMTCLCGCTGDLDGSDGAA